MDSHDLTLAVKAEAMRLGFSLVGITTPKPPPHLDVYLDWLGQGRHGEMAYLATDRARQARAGPRLLLPDCYSILSVGMIYHSQISNFVGNLRMGKISSYALGADYHDMLPLRLRALVTFIEAQVGGPVPNRYYTDAGPLLERDLAQRAGLGWIGKNTCLINPQQGSYFFLAEILLGIELEPDSPFVADHCGSCTRCLDACPTACILPDRTLDARRCISYLTIELKGAIPPELRPLIDDWVFGCDICQQVCPWNQRFAPAVGDPAFTPRPDLLFASSDPNLPHLDLMAELSLNPAAFNRKFKTSPLRRAKRRGYLRNVAVVLGNSYVNTNNAEAIAALSNALNQDFEPLVRGHAAWALGRLGGPVAHQTLADAVSIEPDPWVLNEIQSALVILPQG